MIGWIDRDRPDAEHHAAAVGVLALDVHRPRRAGAEPVPWLVDLRSTLALVPSCSWRLPATLDAGTAKAAALALVLPTLDALALICSRDAAEAAAESDAAAAAMADRR